MSHKKKIGIADLKKYNYAPKKSDQFILKNINNK